MSDKIKLIAIEKTYCAGWHKPGEEFEANPSHARLLTTLRKARLKVETDRMPKRKEVKTEK